MREKCHNCKHRLTYVVLGYCPLKDHDGTYEELFEFGSGAQILTQVDMDDYQGDSIALVFKDDKYAILNWGWGSCSGCDALEASRGIEEELCELFHNLNSLVWYSKSEMIAHIQHKDWSIEWFGRDLALEFKEKALGCLSD